MTHTRLKRLSSLDFERGVKIVCVKEEDLIALELQVEDLKTSLRPFVECEVPQHVVAGLGEAWFYRWHERARKAMKLL